VMRLGRYSTKWTHEDDERLLGMVAAKKPRMLIGAALRRTTRAVQTRLKILRRDLAQTRDTVKDFTPVP
jgi:hypothetical protein